LCSGSSVVQPEADRFPRLSEVHSGIEDTF
jgi:hypothetical protein